ncbi:MAG: hypothetical protein GX610_22680 [Rhodococcus sp.]|nr:hypothetical protein [Rhodococcus sp. (in: high G+C Gram-positive bacteria)]
MNRSTTVPARRFERLLTCAIVLGILGLYAATIGVLRLCIALGWYVS